MSTSAFSRCEPLLTAEKLKSRYFFGVPLEDSYGNEMPLDTLQFAIESAVAYLEQKLDIIILAKNFVENHDYKINDYSEFNFLTLKNRPVREVDLVRAKYPSGSTLVAFPKEWYVVQEEAGQLQIAPGVGAYQNFLAPQGSGNLPLIQFTRSYWPHLFEVTYKAGFCDDAIPMIINEMIGLQASLGILDIMGDLLGGGAGLVGNSTSIDGTSVSNQYAASAMYSSLSARLISYQKRLDGYIEVVRKHYNGIPFVVV